MRTHNVAIRSNLMAVEMLNSLVCRVSSPKEKSEPSKEGVYSLDRVALKQ